AGRRRGRRGGPARRPGPGAGPAAAAAAGRAGAALLGGTQPGRDRGTARLRGRNGEVRRRPRAPAAARAHHPLGRPPTTTDGENVMSNTDTDLLHDSIDRLTAGERLPAGLAARAFRRHRQRRIALRAAAAAGTAVIAGAGMFAAMARPGAVPAVAGPARQAPAGATTQTPATLTAAYVSSHTRQALAAAERANLLQELHTVGQNYPLGLTQVLSFRLNGGGTGHVVEQAGPTASQENTWSYRGQLREQGLDAAGKPL